MEDSGLRGEHEPIRAVGLISGTSMDGIDAATVEISVGQPLQVTLRSYVLHPYPAGVRDALLDVCRDNAGTALAACRLDMVLGEVFAEAALAAIAEAGWDPEAVTLIGSHGQTTVSDMTTNSLAGWRSYSTQQLGHPAVIAERTGITVVADFRARDIAAGGHGAPLVPLLDHLLYGTPGQPRALLNLGGIANLTLLPSSLDPSQVVGFDTGPANMPMDAIMRLTSDGRERFDPEGRNAAEGQVDEDLLAHLLSHPYVQSAPPKATGSEEFGETFARELLTAYPHLSRANLLATLAQFAAESVAQAIHQWFPAGEQPEVILAAGGGTHNRTLMEYLARAVAPTPVRQLESAGGQVDAKEAILFAVLGYLTLRGMPGNLPSATGASHQVPLGSITPGRRGLDFLKAFTA